MIASISPQGRRNHWCASISWRERGSVAAVVVALHLSMSFSGEPSFHVMDLSSRPGRQDGLRVAWTGRDGGIWANMTGQAKMVVVLL